MLDSFGDTLPDQILFALAVLGAAGSVLAFIRNQSIANREAMLSRYDAISRSYIDYQILCLQNPLLNTSWYGEDGSAAALDASEQIRRNLLFDILTSTLERAFITYKSAPKKIRTSQWPGWLAFAQAYAGRNDYRTWWREHVFDFEKEKWREGISQYDIEFERFMRRMLTSE